MFARTPSIFLVFVTFAALSSASLYHVPAPVLTYHNGPVLHGHIPVSIIWYGAFAPTQKSVIADFILSLTSPFHGDQHSIRWSVSRWWQTVEHYNKIAGFLNKTSILLTNQVSDDAYSLGKRITRSQVATLAAKLGVMRGGIAVVLTAADVSVEGFCSSICGMHGLHSSTTPHLWIGNSERQCPAQCAWPFHAARDYAPGRPRLVLRPPNGDVGIDGMVINLAKLLAGVVTNPYGTGWFQGDPGVALEVGAACPGVYGRGAFPGYPGLLWRDPVTGGSYNVAGKDGRKFLVPALVDPLRHECTVVT